ncbi:hypothetical protein JCM8547_000694 [Rhodosporidiobolus lusitaniae]
MASRARPPPQPSLGHQHKLTLLRHLTFVYLPVSPSSALFYAERLVALEPHSESNSYLLAHAFVATGDHLEAIWHLRQPVSFTPESSTSSADDPFSLRRPPHQSTSSSSLPKLTRPAVDCSIRCARLYAQACAHVGRAKEGREALARVLQPGVPFAPQSSQSLPSPSPHFLTTTSSASSSSVSESPWPSLPPPLAPLTDPLTLLDLDLARLALLSASSPSSSGSTSADAERAIVAFRKVLQKAPTCWEALEGLCELGAPPEVEGLLPVVKRAPLQQVQPTQVQAQQVQQQQQVGGKPGLHQQSYPPPLGPSQTAAVNSAWGTTAGGAGGANGFSSSGGLFTPDVIPPAGKQVGGGLFGVGVLNGGGAGVGGGKGKARETVGLFGGAGMVAPGLRRTGSGRHGANGGGDMSMMGDYTTGDESSFDTSFLPSAPTALSFAPSSRLLNHNHNHNNSAPSSTSLFTPPTASSLPTATAPGVKRTRAGNIAPASIVADGDDLLGPAAAAVGARAPAGRRPVRGVPEGSKARSTSSSANSNGINGGGGAPATRRSSRLSANATSSAMAPSRSSQSSQNGAVRTNGTSSSTRDKKRSKAGAGPSVLSDSTTSTTTSLSTTASDTGLSPPTNGNGYAASSSPGPSSPHTTLPALPAPVDPSVLAARFEAEDYVLHLLRQFGKAEVGLARFEGGSVVEAVAGLGGEQRGTARAWRGVGRARFERGEYAAAEKAFLTARQLAPASLKGMDIFSTVLWHLRSPTSLSFLAQELHLLSSSSSTTPSSTEQAGTGGTTSTDPRAWIASGNVFSHLEDHASALRCFKRAAQLSSSPSFTISSTGGWGTEVYAYVLAGHECVMLEEWDRALGFFREAVRRDMGGRSYGAWFGLGNVYLKTGKYTLAEYHFRRAVEINPGNVTLICCVGTVLEKLRRPKEALEMYEKACELQPESALARFKRVRLALAFRQFQLAEQDLLALKHLAPSEPNVHYLLGKLYKQLGPTRRAEMVQAFASSQDLEPRMASVIREQIERPLDEEEGVGGGEEEGRGGMDGDDSRMSG